MPLVAIRWGVDGMKSMKELLAFIYGCDKDAIFCGHCGRPLKIETHNGKKVLICRRCIELQQEAQQEMYDNQKEYEARVRRLKKNG